MELFDFIDALVKLSSFDRHLIEATTGSQMQLSAERAYHHDFRMGDRVVGEQLSVTNIELRAAKPGTDAVSLLAMQIAGRCVPLGEVSMRYPGLSLTDVPRGRSPDEETTFEVKMEGKAVRFGFDQCPNPCLRSLSIEASGEANR